MKRNLLNGKVRFFDGNMNLGGEGCGGLGVRIKVDLHSPGFGTSYITLCSKRARVRVLTLPSSRRVPAAGSLQEFFPPQVNSFNLFIIDFFFNLVNSHTFLHEPSGWDISP